MRQFITISVNAFMELIRQPVFLLLLSASALFSVYLASLPYFGFGDDPKLVKDSVLAVMLLAGLLGAVLCASSSVAREIRTGTEAREGLFQQVPNPVRWSDSIRALIAAGVTRFIEVGPGSVLTGLLRNIDASLAGLKFGEAADLERLEG